MPSNLLLLGLAGRRQHLPDELSSANPSSLVTVWNRRVKVSLPDKALWIIERNSTQPLTLDAT